MQIENRQFEPFRSTHERGPLSERLLTPNEAAIKLKVTPEQVRRLIRGGQISAVNIGIGTKRPLYRISQQALEDFLSRRCQTDPPTRKTKFSRLPPAPDFFPQLK